MYVALCRKKRLSPLYIICSKLFLKILGKIRNKFLNRNSQKSKAAQCHQNISKTGFSCPNLINNSSRQNNRSQTKEPNHSYHSRIPTIAPINPTIIATTVEITQVDCAIHKLVIGKHICGSILHLQPNKNVATPVPRPKRPMAIMNTLKNGTPRFARSSSMVKPIPGRIKILKTTGWTIIVNPPLMLPETRAPWWFWVPFNRLSILYNGLQKNAIPRPPPLLQSLFLLLFDTELLANLAPNR